MTEGVGVPAGGVAPDGGTANGDGQGRAGRGGAVPCADGRESGQRDAAARDRPPHDEGWGDVAAPSRPAPLWRRIAQRLSAGIGPGGLRPGERLPTEAQLAAQFGANRHTVRRAVESLAQSGLVRVEQGRGTFVAEDMLDYAVAPRTRFSEWVRRHNREPTGQVLHLRTIAAPAAVAAGLGIGEGEPVVLYERLGLADGMPVALASHHFPPGRLPGILDALGRHPTITEALRAVGVMDYVRRTTRVGARMPTAAEGDAAARLPHPPAAGVRERERGRGRDGGGVRPEPRIPARGCNWCSSREGRAACLAGEDWSRWHGRPVTAWQEDMRQGTCYRDGIDGSGPRPGRDGIQRQTKAVQQEENMPDGSRDAHVSMSPEWLDESERRALIAAVAEARADPRPAVPHEEVRAEMLRDLADLRRRMEALSPS